MNLQQSPANIVEPPGARTEPKTHLHGLGLFIARAGWVALTLLVLTLNAISIPRTDALMQAICQPGVLCVNGLTPAVVRQLQQIGLSPGFLAAYQIGWDVGTTLIYTALAALIFWRRSTDRLALFCAYMLVLFGGATYTGLLDLGLRTVTPAWYWLVGGWNYWLRCASRPSSCSSPPVDSCPAGPAGVYRSLSSMKCGTSFNPVRTLVRLPGWVP